MSCGLTSRKKGSTRRSQEMRPGANDTSICTIPMVMSCHLLNHCRETAFARKKGPVPFFHWGYLNPRRHGVEFQPFRLEKKETPQIQRHGTSVGSRDPCSLGRGKTSFMNMTATELERKRGSAALPRFATAWFNPWKFGEPEQVWAAYAAVLSSWRIGPQYSGVRAYAVNQILRSDRPGSLGALNLTIPVLVLAPFRVAHSCSQLRLELQSYATPVE